MAPRDLSKITCYLCVKAFRLGDELVQPRAEIAVNRGKTHDGRMEINVNCTRFPARREHAQGEALIAQMLANGCIIPHP